MKIHWHVKSQRGSIKVVIIMAIFSNPYPVVSKEVQEYASEGLLSIHK